MGQRSTDKLRQILVPDLIQVVGDPKTHLVTADLVRLYLQRERLIFDEQTLNAMFTEADFKQEGGLSSGPLVAAIQGRFPKRRFGQKHWLALLSAIFKRPVADLQSLLAPAKSQATPAAQSVDTSQPATAFKTKHSTFVTKPVTGEWGTLIRAASQTQPSATGSRTGAMMMTIGSATLQSTAPAAMQRPIATPVMQHMPSAAATMSAGRFTPHSSLSNVALQPTDTRPPSVQFHDDMGSSVMSIDTPSYANSLGLGQPGLQSRFTSNAGALSQDLAQSMSIDSNLGMQPWETFKPGATFASPSHMSATMGATQHAFPIMMMTTSGPKCLSQTPVEEGINQDIRQGCSSFASQQQYQQHAAGFKIMSDMASDAAHKKRLAVKRH